jgi:choline-phosphate cytidylyltransferase/glycerol-3-phosphate cytidylyltransferase
VLDATGVEPVAELMAAADVLVSDYSSMLIDWELTNRPAVVYAPDLDHYRDDERGFYRDWPASSPFPVVTTRADLTPAINTALESVANELPRADPGRAGNPDADQVTGLLRLALDDVNQPTKHVALQEPQLKRVITYGTYDLLHYGHIELLRRARALGDYLIVALSSEEFNAGKGKQTYFRYEDRKRMLEAVRYVDLVIPELTWEQKINDIKNYAVDTFVMGDDWTGKFDFLKPHCEVVYLHRTPEISSTQIKTELAGVK